MSDTTEQQAVPRRPRKRRKVERKGTTPDLAELKRQYEDQRMPVRALGERHGMSYGKTHSMLQEAGAKMRPRGGDRTKRPHTADTAKQSSTDLDTRDEGEE